MRNLFLLCVAVLVLTACKVEIDMPPGGSLVSSSGLYGCAANEQCTLVIDHPYFKERLTAVPVAGYAFSRWADIPRGFCRGIREKTCDQINTGLFLGDTNLLTWLAGDYNFSLTPIFVKMAGQPASANEVWQVHSTHMVVNYPVEGSTATTIYEAMIGDANPLAVSSSTGRKPVGRANRQLRWNFTYRSDSATANCKILSGSINLNYTTTLPQLTNFTEKSAAIQNSWNAFQDQVAVHEAGHQELNRSYYERIPALFTAASAVPCDQANAAISAALDALNTELDLAQDEYHAQVGYETSFSAYFQASPARAQLRPQRQSCACRG